MFKTTTIKWAEHVVHIRRSGMLVEFMWESQKETYHQVELDVGSRIILSWILKKWNGMDWIPLAQDREQWMTLVNMVLNLRVGKFLSN
jgi:hypothetical protein